MEGDQLQPLQVHPNIFEGTVTSNRPSFQIAPFSVVRAHSGVRTPCTADRIFWLWLSRVVGGLEILYLSLMPPYRLTSNFPF